MRTRRRQTQGSSRGLHARVGPLLFAARLDRDGAPKSVDLLTGLLPLRGFLQHARWSGEAGWLPLKQRVPLEPENATAYPAPGQVLLYGGGLSEPELLLCYGACAFASQAGALAGNPVLRLDARPEQLRELGRLLLQEGAQAFHLGWATAKRRMAAATIRRARRDR